MNRLLPSLQDCLQGDWVEHVGWTLLHSLWQIAFIAAVYFVASFLLRKSSAHSRYLAGCAAFIAMLVAPAVSYCLLSQRVTRVIKIQDTIGSTPSEVIALPATVEFATPNAGPDSIEPEALEADVTNPSADAMHSEVSMLTHASLAVHPWLPLITKAWLVGVLLLSLRPVAGCFHVRRLRRVGLSPLPDPVREACDKLAQRMRVRGVIRFCQSSLVRTPSVIGYLRPLVLLPVSTVTGLTSNELELILAHELAHIRRHDYIVNLVQTLIEALLFYHPGMWWVSNQVRRERENCCDDIAVAISDDRATYVRALAQLEEHRIAAPALAATGGSLLSRVRRIVGEPESEFVYRKSSLWLTTVAMVSVTLTAFAFASMPLDQRERTEDSMETVTNDDGEETAESSALNFDKLVGQKVAQVIRDASLPFVDEGRLKEIEVDFTSFMNFDISYGTWAVGSSIPEDHRQAILRAIEEHGAQHLRLDRFRQHDLRSINLAYLGLPDQLLTLKWKLHRAIVNARTVDEDKQAKLESQRLWMKQYIRSLPVYRTFTHEMALSGLEERFADPLACTLGYPMTDDQFDTFRQELQKYSAKKELAYVVSHIVQQSLNARYRDFTDFELPFKDRVVSYGAGRVIYLGFERNRPFVNSLRSIFDIENSGTIVDATTGYPITVPEDLRGDGDMQRWLNEKGQGDFGFDDDQNGWLFSIRDAKMTKLDVKTWHEADAISNDKLRALLESRAASNQVSLDDYYQDHQQDNGAPYCYAGVLTKEGRLAVVAVEDFSGRSSIGVRTRARSALPTMKATTLSDEGVTISFDRPANWVADDQIVKGGGPSCKYRLPASEREGTAIATMKVQIENYAGTYSVDVTTEQNPAATVNKVLTVAGEPARLISFRLPGVAGDSATPRDLMRLLFGKGTRGYDLTFVFPSDQRQQYVELALAVGQSIRIRANEDEVGEVSNGEANPQSRKRAVSNKIGVTVPTKQPDAVTWGPVNEGLQLGIDTADVQAMRNWKPGSKLSYTLWIKNASEQPIPVTDSIPVRGWYPELRDQDGNRVALPMPPIEGPVQIRERSLAGGAIAEVGRLWIDMPDNFKPGIYSFRQAYRITSGSRDLFPLKVSADLRIGQEVEQNMESTDWGKRVQGVQIRTRLTRQGGKPSLVFDLRNNGKKSWLFEPSVSPSNLAFTVWSSSLENIGVNFPLETHHFNRKQSPGGKLPTANAKILNPGRAIEGLSFPLDDQWVAQDDEGRKLLEVLNEVRTSDVYLKRLLQCMLPILPVNEDGELPENEDWDDIAVWIAGKPMFVPIYTPDHTVRIQGDQIRTGTISGKVKGDFGPYSVFLEHEDWKNKLGRLPHLLVKSDETFEFTNVPVGECVVSAKPTLAINKGKLQQATLSTTVEVKDSQTATADLLADGKLADEDEDLDGAKKNRDSFVGLYQGKLGAREVTWRIIKHDGSYYFKENPNSKTTPEHQKFTLVNGSLEGDDPAERFRFTPIKETGGLIFEMWNKKSGASQGRITLTRIDDPVPEVSSEESDEATPKTTQTDWGPEVEGFQSSLSMNTRPWIVGESGPLFHVAVRYRGDPRKASSSMDSFVIEVDDDRFLLSSIATGFISQIFFQPQKNDEYASHDFFFRLTKNNNGIVIHQCQPDGSHIRTLTMMGRKKTNIRFGSSNSSLKPDMTVGEHQLRVGFPVWVTKPRVSTADAKGDLVYAFSPAIKTTIKSDRATAVLSDTNSARTIKVPKWPRIPVRDQPHAFAGFGTFYIRDDDQVMGRSLISWDEIEPVDGQLYIPSGKALGIGIDSGNYTDLSALQTFAPDGLQSLSLPLQNKIDDRAMPSLAQLTGLKRLLLGGSAITDKGLPHLAKLKKLKYLSLQNCPVTDQSIDILAQLTSLQEINLWRTWASKRGAEKLQRALPGCRVEWLEATDKVHPSLDRSGSPLPTNGPQNSKVTELKTAKDLNLTNENHDLRWDRLNPNNEHARMLREWKDIPYEKARAAGIKSSELPEIWEAVPAGSKSYEIRKDVRVANATLDTMIYERPDLKQFWIQRDPPGSSFRTWFGPFDGDPYEVLGIKMASPNAANTPEKIRVSEMQATPVGKPRLQFRLELPDREKPWPVEAEAFHWNNNGQKESIRLAKEISLDEDDVVAAKQSTPSKEPMEPILELTFTEAGGRKLYTITKAAVADCRRLVILFDGKVIAAPRVMSAASKLVSITGLTTEEIAELSKALPVKIDDPADETNDDVIQVPNAASIKGLSSRLERVSPKGPIRIGDALHFNLILKNDTDQPIEFDWSTGSMWQPIVDEQTRTIVLMGMLAGSGRVEQQRIVVPPKREETLHQIQYRVVPKNFKSQSLPLPLRVTPGDYQILAAGILGSTPRQEIDFQPASRLQFRKTMPTGSKPLEREADRVKWIDPNGKQETLTLYKEIFLDVDDVQCIRQPANNVQSILKFLLTDDGANRMRSITKPAVGKGQRLVILLDGEVVAAPVVKSVLSDQVSITGFDPNQAKLIREYMTQVIYYRGKESQNLSVIGGDDAPAQGEPDKAAQPKPGSANSSPG